MATESHGGGKFVQFNQAVPTATVTAPTPFMGDTLAPPTVTGLLPGAIFDARGVGRFDLGNRFSGLRGTMDLLIQTGAAGAARTIAYLTDNTVSPTRYLALKIDSSNRPRAVVTDNTGSIIIAATPTYAAIPAGQTVTVRFAWNSEAIYNGRLYATLRVNNSLIPEANWSTDPTWRPFRPSHLVLVGPNLSDADFNGTVLACQLSEEVTT